MSEDPDKPYFAFSATLRIHGEGLDFDRITRSMGLRPTYTHKMGDPRRFGAASWQHDVWHDSAGLPEETSLEAHLQTLWADIAPARDFLLSMKSQFRVDVLCGYRSNSDHAGFQVEPKSLAIFADAAEVPDRR